MKQHKRGAERRSLPWPLAALITLLVLSTSITAANAQSTATATPTLPFILKPLAPGVYAAIDGPQHSAGSNAGVVIGDDGVLVVDSFFDPEAAKALLAEIRKLTPKPVRYVVNTHYHIDHVAGDAVFREAGAIIVAHRNVRGWVRTENIHLLGEAITPARRALVEHLALPDLVTDKDLSIWLGDRRVMIRAFPGHTGGDLVVGVPDAKVLFCGDLLWRHVSPNIIDGTVSEWIQTAAAFEQLPEAAAITFVPGHGDLATAADVEAFRAYLADLSSLTAEARRAGLSGEALVGAVLPKLKASHGDWESFDRVAPREIRFMDAELAGTKRVPIPAD